MSPESLYHSECSIYRGGDWGLTPSGFSQHIHGCLMHETISSNGMEWNGIEWDGMEWNGMGWNGMEWNGMEWNGMEWNGMMEEKHTSIIINKIVRT